MSNLHELYSDKNLYETVKSIRRDLLDKFDVESEEYQEELASKFYLLCKRMRDNYLDSVLQALPEEKKLTEYFGAGLGNEGYKDIGFNECLIEVKHILNEARDER